MNYLELSTEDVRNESIKLADIVSKDYNPDVIIFVSKGAFQIGLAIGGYYNVPVVEIFAKRNNGKLKEIASPFLKIIPSSIKRKLRNIELNSNIHSRDDERHVCWGYIPDGIDLSSFKRVLLVDDSCDTGNTFARCTEEIKKRCPFAIIKTAVLNVFEKSKALFKTDYFLYSEYIIQGPWSNDSKEHKKFLESYKKFFKK